MALGRRPGRNSLVLAAVTLAVAVGTAVLHVPGIWAALSATLGALAVGVCATYLVQWWAERREPAETDSAVDRLEAWRRDLRIAILRHRVRDYSQLYQMLPRGSIINLRTVRFELTEGHDRVPKPRFTGSPVTFDELAAEWALRPSRLVIIAQPGYGKTVAALTLLSLVNGADDSRNRPIAELFPLAEWFRWHLDHPEGELAEWLAAQLATNYQITGEAARGLVDYDLIIPLLDGLDEIPGDYRVTCADAIDAYAGRVGRFRPFALTCRTREYRDLAPRWVGADRQVGFAGLDAREICQILRARTAGLPGWSFVRENAEAGNRVLLELFRSPLRLSVALQAYAERDPRELLDLPEAAAESRIWDLMLGRTGDAAPSPAYSALMFLATRMQLLSTAQFRLHELYRYVPDRAAVYRRFRNWLSWTAGLTVGVIAGIADAIDNGLTRGHVGLGIANGAIDGVLFGLIFGFAAHHGTREGLVVRLPTALALRRSWVWAAAGALWGLVAGLFNGGDVVGQHVLANPVANAVARGLITAAVYAVVLGMIGFVFASSLNRSASPPPSLAARAPEAVLTAARYRWLLMAAGGAIMGVALGLIASGPVAVAIVAPLTALGCGLAGGLGTWLYHYRLRWLLARGGLLPRRLPGFLNWCAEPKRSWLRICDGYEFRHRELLDHLAAQWAIKHGREWRGDPAYSHAGEADGYRPLRAPGPAEPGP